MARSINPVPQYFGNDGTPLESGKVFYFESGTNTPKTTYADVNQTIANAHPVILDGVGRLPNVFFDGTARQVLEDKNGVQIWERDPVTAGDNGGAFSAYDAQTIYSKNSLVLADDENYYRSLQDGNQNNEPSTSPAFWNLIEFLETHNVNIDYPVGANVKTSDGFLWRGVTTPNLGNAPVSSDEWTLLGLEAAFVQNYTVTFETPGFINLIQNISGNARVVFNKSASSASAQVIGAFTGKTGQITYVNDTTILVDECRVDSTNVAGVGVATDDFVIIRFRG